MSTEAGSRRRGPIVDKGGLEDQPHIMRYVERCFCNEFVRHISMLFGVRVFARGRGWARVCLVPKGVEPYLEAVASHAKVVSSGLTIGWAREGLGFVPSTHLFNLARDEGFEFGCAVVAKRQGVKTFLYGNDLLLASVEEILKPAEKEMYVAVLDWEDRRAVGIGRLVIDPNDLPKLVAEGKALAVVVKNVFDLGVLLRDESYV